MVNALVKDIEIEEGKMEETVFLKIFPKKQIFRNQQKQMFNKKKLVMGCCFEV